MNVDKFRSKVKEVARLNRYRVIIPNFFDGDLYQYLAKEVELPGKEFRVANLNFWGSEISLAQSVDFDPLSITFYTDNELKVKKDIDNWMNEIFDLELWTVGYYEDYVVDMFVEILNNNGDVIEKIKIEKAYPKNIGSISLSYESENEPFIITVQFQYWNWKKV